MKEVEGLRKPSLSELAVTIFAGYMALTLTVAPTMFEDAIANNPESMYANYMMLLGTQSNLAWISLTVALASFAALFTEHYTVRMLTSVLGLVYFTFISASYLFNYPNIGLGIVILVISWLFIELWKLIDESEEVKKRQIIVDNQKDKADDDSPIKQNLTEDVFDKDSEEETNNARKQKDGDS